VAILEQRPLALAETLVEALVLRPSQAGTRISPLRVDLLGLCVLLTSHQGATAMT